jgi:hypothetical protein
MRIRFSSGKARTDPEKLVTPGILFCKKTIGDRSGLVIAVGWWDYFASVRFAWQAHLTKGQADD